MAIKAEVKNGNVTITLPFDVKGTVSGSGKSLNHATTNGNVPVEIEGKIYSLGINLYSKNPEFKK